MAGLMIFFQSPIPKRYPTLSIIICFGIMICLLLVGIHIQIPDQDYCNSVYESHNNGVFGYAFYKESLTKYDYSLNESKCIYSEDGKFIANPKFSIWGVRI